MNILIVEDRPTHRTALKNLLLDFNENITVTEANSYKDLMEKLFSCAFDGAIIDINLTKWEDFLPEKGLFFRQERQIISDGLGIANLVCNINNNKNKIILYSANESIPDNTPYFSFEKKFDNEFLREFEQKVIAKIIEPEEIAPVPSYVEFNRFCTAQKICHYKQVIALINSEQRFKYIGNFSWCSNYFEDGKAVFGVPLDNVKKRSRNFLTHDYHKLLNLLKLQKIIPTLFWNFIEEDYFYTQTESIASAKKENETLNIFFNISLSNNLSRRLSETNTKSSSFNKFTSFLSKQDKLGILTTQVYTIRALQEKGYKDVVIHNSISQIANKTGYKVVDLFEGILNEYDKVLDTAWVHIKSLINPNRQFNREFRYSRLISQGIKYKHSAFLYYIAESSKDSSVTSYLEPKK